MSDLDAVVAEYAERFEVDPGTLGESVRRALIRRQANGQRPFKACPCCQCDLPALAFDADERTADGLAMICKSCRRARQRKGDNSNA